MNIPFATSSQIPYELIIRMLLSLNYSTGQTEETTEAVIVIETTQGNWYTSGDITTSYDSICGSFIKI